MEEGRTMMYGEYDATPMPGPWESVRVLVRERENRKSLLVGAGVVLILIGSFIISV